MFMLHACHYFLCIYFGYSISIFDPYIVLGRMEKAGMGYGL